MTITRQEFEMRAHRERTLTLQTHHQLSNVQIMAFPEIGPCRCLRLVISSNRRQIASPMQLKVRFHHPKAQDFSLASNVFLTPWLPRGTSRPDGTTIVRSLAGDILRYGMSILPQDTQLYHEAALRL